MKGARHPAQRAGHLAQEAGHPAQGAGHLTPNNIPQLDGEAPDPDPQDYPGLEHEYNSDMFIGLCYLCDRKRSTCRNVRLFYLFCLFPECLC